MNISMSVPLKSTVSSHVVPFPYIFDFDVHVVETLRQQRLVCLLETLWKDF